MILLPFISAYPLATAMPGTIVAVDPTESNVKVGQTFDINVNITDVSGLLGFDFMLSYDTAILKLIDIKEGPFMKSVGSTFMINLTTQGLVWLAVALYSTQGSITSANGSGVLATATFKAIAAGETVLDLFSKDPCKPDEIKLASDPPPDDVVHIPNVAVDGHVVVSSDPADPPPDPDPPEPPPNNPAPIAHAHASKTVVGQGYNLGINVTTANQGGLTMAFYVASYANTTQIGRRTLALPNGSSATLSFVWNTTGFLYGNYSISAYAWPVTEQANVTKDTSADGWVIVTIQGDLNGDFTIDIRDAILEASAFGSNPNSPKWNPNADINEDNTVDTYDAIILANHFGQHYP
jgi:hypothetical protein